jgi:hypothetical protein
MRVWPVCPKFMFRPHRFLLSVALAGLCVRSQAAIPPAQKLLPKDIVMVVTAPDWTKARAFVAGSPYGQLWQDPAMKPFADKFLEKFTMSVLKPAEQSLGIKFADYQGLFQGQVTFALLPVTPKIDTDSHFAGLLMVDAKDHAGQLKTDLEQIIKKWADAGKPTKTQKIRDLNFTTIIASSDDFSLSKIVPNLNPTPPPDDPAAKTPPRKVEITLGQSGSLLVVSDSPEAIDKVLSLQAGGMAPSLEESASFQADYSARLRESPAYVWLNLKALVSILTKTAAGDTNAQASPVSMTTILNTTGAANLVSASFSYQNWPGGTGAQLFVSVPEDKRPAFVKIFTADAKDSSPPSFVPADAVKFSRWRLNISRSYKALEAMLTELLPTDAMAQINMVFKMAGKDKDEHYDLKSELLDNAGDDIISYSKAPRSAALADWKSPPSLVLLGSPQPDKLAAAVKVLMGIFSPGAAIKDREFLGRKIYTTGSPATAGAPSSGMSFSASGGYLAISGDPAILEEYLRSSGNTTKTLMDTPGLADVAQKAGGMATGLFGFENDNLAARPLFDLLRKQPTALAEFFSSPIPGAPSGAPGPLDSLREWVDFSLLPPFDTVSKYFHYSVYAGSFSPDGFALKMFAPAPPQLQQ